MLKRMMARNQNTKGHTILQWTYFQGGMGDDKWAKA